MTEQDVVFLRERFPGADFQTLSDLSATTDGKNRCLNETDHKHAALLQAVNFDKVKENWYQSRFHDQVKSCDALYYHDSAYYLLEFKTGDLHWLDVLRKIYDSIIGLIEHGKLTLDECRRNLNVILVANHAENSPNKALANHLQQLAKWTYPMDESFLKSLNDNDIRRLTNFLVKWAYRMTPDDFDEFVKAKEWCNSNN